MSRSFINSSHKQNPSLGLGVDDSFGEKLANEELLIESPNSGPVLDSLMTETENPLDESKRDKG